MKVLQELTPSERLGFVETVLRISDNLSEPKNERDEQLRDRVREIRNVVDE